MYLLDTNICIYLIKKKDEKILEELSKREPTEVGLSVITVAELEYGVAKSAYPERNNQALQLFLGPLDILPFDAPAAFEFGKIRAFLERKGRPVGVFDMMIGAHALSLGRILVTNNEREFSRIPELALENWSK